MIAAIKDWLPITVRNRVALGFAVVALVIFLTWNFLPYYRVGMENSEVRYYQAIWPEFLNPDNYKYIAASLDLDALIFISVNLSLLFNGLLVIAIIPFWKTIHASKYLTVPLAAANTAGGCLYMWMLYSPTYAIPYMTLSITLIGISMWITAVSLFIFKNELGLRHEREVKKMMSGE